MNTKELCFKLTGLYGVSGTEDELFSAVSDILGEYMPVRQDKLHNIIGRCEGRGKHILLDAHLDRIGLIVRGIDENGFVLFDKCGGCDTSVVIGSEVIILGEKEIFGVISSVPPHLSKGEDKIPEITELAIDVGYDRQECEKHICQGDRIIIKSYPCELLNENICASSLDNRASVTAILKCLDILKNENVKPNLTIVFSSLEEINGNGAKTASFQTNPDEAIVVDVTFAAQPNVKETESGKTEGGAMIGFSPVLDRSMSLALCKAAEKHNIPYQKEVMGSRTGTNADSYQNACGGVPCATVSVPIKNMHTPVETVSLQDIENTAKLLACYIIENGVEE